MRRFALLLLPLAAGCGVGAERPIVIGSKNFTEQVLLAEMVAQQIETRAGLPVERRVNLGGTLICHEALTAGEIDLYVEYTGTALMAILDEPPGASAPEILRHVRDEYRRRFDLEWTEPLGFNNTFAVLVRGREARRLGLRSISDLNPHAPDLRIGFGFEFYERADGYRGLIERYGLRFAGPPKTMELGLVFRAIEKGRIDVAVGNSTDGLIAALDLVALEDDRSYFPPYEAAPVVRRGTLARHPDIGAALSELAGSISEERMRTLNYRVDGEGRDVARVAREFLRGLNSAPDGAAP